MSPRWSLVVCSILTLLAAGCSSLRNTPARNVEVIAEGSGQFPDSLSGRWKADRDGWEFVFERHGGIASAVISLGRVRVTPGRKTVVPTRTGGEAVFDPGPWTVHYVPSTRELTIKITMDYVRVEMAGNTLEGNSTDVFSGALSPAEGIWQAEWTTFTDYTARTPDHEVIDLSTDPIYGETKHLTFQKVQE
jgi:hypothetical protein